MKRTSISKTVLVAISLLLLGTSTGYPQTQDPLLSKAAAIKKYLEKMGYQVLGRPSYHRYVELDFTKLYCAGISDSCNGNNYNAPYLTAIVPPLPGQADTPLPFLFRIRRNEAVVLIGPTPPPCDYYSYVCFLFNRHDEGWGPTNAHRLFASFGDNLNRFVIKTGGTDFNKDIVLAFTSDMLTDKAIRAASVRAGFSKEVLNTYVIPSALLKTNNALDETTDQLVIGQRTALWRDGTSDGGGYIENPKVVVFRVTPPHTFHSPFRTPRERVRGTGRTEFDLLPAVDRLKKAILKRYSNTSAQELITAQWSEVSPLALQKMTNAVGESSDAAYMLTNQFFKLSNDPDDFLIVYGVNHHRSRKATYHNINIYQAYKYCGVASAFDHCNGNSECTSFEDSAREYFSGDFKDSDQLYALKVARKCNGEPYCLEVPTGECGQGTGLNEELMVGFRAYVEPKTSAGPAYTELILDRVIHFTPSPPSLHLDSNNIEVDYPGPATVSFNVSATSTVSWEVKVEYPDDVSGATIKPNQGVIKGGNGTGTFILKGDNAGSYHLTITVKDQQSRFASTEAIVTLKKP